MKPRAKEIPRAQKSTDFQGEGPNWILIAGGALLSTLSVRLGYKLKQALDAKQQENANDSMKGNGKSLDKRKSGGYHMRSAVYSFAHDEDGCFNCTPGVEDMMEMKKQPNGRQILTESDAPLPLVTVSSPKFNKENGIIWSTSPDRLEHPLKPFHHSNSSDSPCVSESGSDIFSKRDVIHKLRQQLKRRDEMILEMQNQITQLQNSVNAELSHSSHLQSLLDASNRDLFESEREIQRLRKAIADHCVGQVDDSDVRNGHENGYVYGESELELEKGWAEGERIEMLRREMGELKEVIEGKEYLLQSYKEQKSELSMKVKELQQKLDSQVPNIL